MKIPCMMNARDITGAETGTPENEIVSTLAIAASALTTTAVVAIGVVLLIPLQPIIQSPALNDEEIATASKIVIDGGADFVKTANGEFGCTTVHQVEVISKAIGNSGKIKCSIPENLDTVYQWLDIPGVERLGLTTWGFLDLYNEANARCGK